jgi:hypothetical protein
VVSVAAAVMLFAQGLAAWSLLGHPYDAEAAINPLIPLCLYGCALVGFALLVVALITMPERKSRVAAAAVVLSICTMVMLLVTLFAHFARGPGD